MSTSYIDEESQRIQSREMRIITKTALKEQNERLIKSKETVRSFGKPRTKRSYQANNIEDNDFGHLKDQKKDAKPKRHINIHYNRAFNYTLLLFSKNSPLKEKKLALRITFDDKAYLQCNTSEGFSRPIHQPIQLTDLNLKFQLPTSDYPEKCGYITPGVILMVNDEEEIEFRGRDKFVPTDLTVAVTVKPRMVCSSNATNWETDRCATRLQFGNEHEFPSITTEQFSEELLMPLIFIRDLFYNLS